jgi:hypothetical protein
LFHKDPNLDSTSVHKNPWVTRASGSPGELYRVHPEITILPASRAALKFLSPNCSGYSAVGIFECRHLGIGTANSRDALPTKRFLINR